MFPGASHLLLLCLHLLCQVQVLVFRPPNFLQERSDLVREVLFEVQIHQLLRFVMLKLFEHLNLFLQLF